MFKQKSLGGKTRGPFRRIERAPLLQIIVEAKAGQRLTRQEFNDDIGVDWQRDIGRSRSSQHGGSEAFGIERYPVQRSGRDVGDDSAVEVTNGLGAADFDHISWSEGERRRGYLDPIDFEVSVNDPLAGLWPCFCKSESSDDIIESSFAHQKEGFAGVTLFADGIIEVPA